MASSPTGGKILRVAIIGSGNWGSAIASIIGGNVKNQPNVFHKEVRMWVFEEEVNGRKLTEIINQEHENVKYLPGIKLPDNIVAEPDLVKTAQDADMLFFVIPHQFIAKTCQTLAGKIKPDASAISLIKGLSTEPGKIGLISDIIKNTLKIECGVLMGANVANEVALQQYCETTIAFQNLKHGEKYKEAIQTDNFRVSLVDDVKWAELCGALKNIVAFGAGLIDGLYGERGGNTKAAVIRIGFMEMIDFAEKFFPGGHRGTFLESCGIADIITTSYGGRNRKVAAAFAKQPDKSIEDLQTEMLNGQQLQGPGTAEEVNAFLKEKNAEDDFPLFTAVHRICKQELKPEELVAQLRNHPIHKSDARISSF